MTAESARDLARAESELRAARQRLAHSMAELQDHLSRVLDWRDWVQRRPAAALCLALTTGLLLGTWLPRRRR